MKKISLVFLVLLSGLLSSLDAQPTSIFATASTTDPVLLSFIREYNYPATICCNIYDTTTGHYLISFSYQDDVSMQTRKVSLWNYIINDFKVSNDSVFFCGHNNAGYGIIGFFDIQDLFFNNGNYYIQDVFEVMSHNDVFRVNDFTKLVTYVNNNNERHIVCIGHAFDISTSSNSGCVVDFFKYRLTHKEEDTARPGSPWSYNSGVLFKTIDNSLLDIVIAGDWIVTAGFEDPDPYHITLRSYNPHDVFSASGPQNNYYDFDMSGIPYARPRHVNNDEILLAYLQNDTIATAFTWNVYEGTSNTTRLICIAQYRINQYNGLIQTPMISINQLSFPSYTNEVNMKGFLGNRREKRMALLFEGTTSANDTHSIFWESNYNMSFQRSHTNYDNHMQEDQGLTSIDLFNNNQYVMYGHYIDCNYIYNYRVETSGINSKCKPSVECNLFPFHTTSATIKPYEFSLYGGIGNVMEVQRYALRIWPISINCAE